MCIYFVYIVYLYYSAPCKKA